MSIFVPNRYSAEDHISIGLCYIFNLCPDSIAEQFLTIIHNKSNKSNLGKFVKAEFIGHEYISDKAASRPDIRIETSECNLYIEIKVDSKPDKDQISRHLKSINKNDYLILLSKYDANFSANDFKFEPLITPKERANFQWNDLEQLFSKEENLNPTQIKIIDDFKSALFGNGLKTRTYKNFAGSIYEDASEAQHNFLLNYKDLIKSAGWKASKRIHEYTIRVNPFKIGSDILLNPRIEHSPTFDDKCIFQESDCSTIFVYNFEDIEKYKTKLNKLSTLTSNQLQYVEIKVDYEPDSNYGFYKIGWLAMPLKFDLQNNLIEAEVLSNWSVLKKTLFE